MSIRLELPLPPSINKTSQARINWQSGKVYKPYARLKDEYQDWVRLVAVTAGVYRQGMKGPIGLTIKWHSMNNTRIDIDNGIKTLVDGLAAAIGFNDRQIMRLFVERGLNSPSPHCVVELFEIEEGKP